jgi:hypothetical protein
MPYPFPNAATHAKSNYDTLSDSNSDRPSHRNADAERLPWRRVLAVAINTAARHGDTFADANGVTNTAANAKSNAKSNGFARASSGFKYLDALAS